MADRDHILHVFDDNIDRLESYHFDTPLMIATMENLYKQMELYYRIKLLRKTIKEQIEESK